MKFDGPKFCQWWQKWQKTYFLGYLIGLLTLFFGACFWLWAQKLITPAILLFSLPLVPQQLVVTYLCLPCFAVIIPNLHWLRGYLLLLLVVRYVVAVVRRQRTLRYWSLIPMALMAAYLISPVHPVHFWSMLLVHLPKMFWLYLVYAYRDQISFKTLVLSLAASIISSGLLGLLAFGETRLSYLSAYAIAMLLDGSVYYRSSGLFVYTNQLAAYAALTLCGLLLLQYRRQISHYQFYLCFVSLFLLAFPTLSRDLVLSLTVAAVIFSGLIIYQRRRQAWRTLVPLAAIVLGVMLLFFPLTKAYCSRLGIAQEAPANNATTVALQTQAEPTEVIEPGSDAWWEQVYAGKILYDTQNRGETWALYWQACTKSPQTFFFGCGLEQPYIGMVYPHNTFLTWWWQYGLIGILIILAFLCSLVDWSALRQRATWRHLGVCCLFVVPMFLFAIFDDGLWGVAILIFLVADFGCDQTAPCAMVSVGVNE